MKKISKIVVALLLSVAMTGCSSNSATTESNEAATPTTSETSNGKEHITVGAIQYVEHVALNAATEGFLAALNDNGYIEGENLTVDMNNAQNDQSNCETIASKLVNNNVDIIFANATPAAQAVAAKTTTIPVVLTSVTDPETSGLVATNKEPGGNVTGTSDLTPVKEQIDLLTQLLPEAKTIAVMYCGSEDNSIFQANMAKEAIKAVGLEYIEATVSDSNAIQSVTESLIGKCDAIYIPTDNLLAEGMATVSMVANANNLPTIVGEEGMVSNGGLATYGINYYNLGYKTGEMAIAIMDGSDPATMPIEYLPAEDCALTINKTTADELGITIPEELSAKANIVE